MACTNGGQELSRYECYLEPLWIVRDEAVEARIAAVLVWCVSVSHTVSPSTSSEISDTQHRTIHSVANVSCIGYFTLASAILHTSKSHGPDIFYSPMHDCVCFSNIRSDCFSTERASVTAACLLYKQVCWHNDTASESVYVGMFAIQARMLML